MEINILLWSRRGLYSVNTHAFHGVAKSINWTYSIRACYSFLFVRPHTQGVKYSHVESSWPGGLYRVHKHAFFIFLMNLTRGFVVSTKIPYILR
jgi:hypothetical protein